MKFLRFFVAIALVIAASHALRAQGTERVPASSIPSEYLIQPEDLAKQLEGLKLDKALILQVGSRVMFAQAHIPGSEFAGPAGKEDGLQVLKDRLADVPKSTSVVLYCGCCPWGRCPNIAKAYLLLRDQGFTHLKVLYIAEDFGTNWVSKGYPTEKGK